jgi:ribosomal subunit interface protein
MKMANFKVNIKATNYELTAEIKEYIDHQISKFQKFLPKGTEETILYVEVGKTTQHHSNGPVFKAEFNMEYKGQLLRSESIQEDVKSAIDIASDEMSRQIRKNKERKTDLFRKGSKKIKSWIKFGK